MQGPRNAGDDADGEPTSNSMVLTSVDVQFPNNSIGSSGRQTYATSSLRDVRNHNWLEPSDQVNSAGSKTDHSYEEGQSGLNRGGVQIESSFSRGSSSTHMLRNGSELQTSGVIESSLGSSSQTAEERSNGPGSALGGLGSSCKRKAFEGAPSHSFPGNLDASSSLSVSMPSRISQNAINQFGQPGFGMVGGRTVSASETLSRHGRRFIPEQSQPCSFVSETSPSSQPSMIHLPTLTRNIHQFAQNASSSRTNNITGEGFELPRINSEQSYFTSSVIESRNSMQDWRVNPNASGDSPFVPQSRISEVAPPWSLFTSIEPESSSNGVSLPLLPTGSSNEAAVPSGSSSRSLRSRQRRSALLLERQNDLLHLRVLGRNLAADNDGRNQLISEIRQVLSAMRRGETLRFEDYTVLDPLIYQGLTEMHDRHRDMRLDVDNMSYEELLALGERIGEVSTGISEDVILKVMKQHKHISSGESHQDIEPCCVCQEEYEEGDDLGTLGCGHEFHTACVKQWLILKNLCPICKTVALST